MSVEYNDLHSLIFQDGDARQYFNGLPAKIRDQINARSGKITSYEKLYDYAENLLRGYD